MDRPDFSLEVARNGYAWWYVDGLSDDGRFGVTVIAFVGSVFSPYYALARRRAAPATVDPERHVAINVAVYRPRGKRWAMTERSRDTLHRDADRFQVGPSAWRWQDDALTITLSERGAPVPRPIAGTVRLIPRWLNAGALALDAGGSHRWQPFAPQARIEVTLTEPSLQWRGEGYLDGNVGGAPLADAFHGWQWSRLASAQRTDIIYDVHPRHGSPRTMTLMASERYGLETVSPGQRRPLPGTLWQIHREGRADDRLLRTLEDTPFYARSEIRGLVDGEPARGVHEALDLDRLRTPWVNMMLPFRMPRRGGGGQ